MVRDELSAAQITRFLQTEGLNITVYPTLDSTNERCKARAAEGAPEGTVILSAMQTAGKGTHGRSFYSPDQTGLYMSLLLRPAISPTDALFITTAAAVAVCRAIEHVSERRAAIKWVNDVYMDDRKVCGILTEASLDPKTGGLAAVTLGIGINVVAPKTGFPGDLSGVAGAVFETEEPLQRARLAAAVLDAFFAEYATLSERRFIREYQERSLLYGRTVTVSTPSGDRSATVTAIDERCRLAVRYENGEEALLSSGDVRLRI